jgi:integrase
MLKETEQLTLFDCGGINLSQLRHARETLQEAPRALATLAAYRIGWGNFSDWCARAGRAAQPALPDTVTLYITWLLLDRERKTSTAVQHLSAIAHYHRAAKLASPVTKEARNVITAVRRQRRERFKQAAAFDPDDLLRVSRACPSGTNLGVRDRALVILGFATGMRRSELAELQLSDIRFHPEGLAVMIRFSKTDQERRGREVAAWAGKRSATDPVRVLRAWLRRRGNADGPLFLRIQTADRITKRGITPTSVNRAVKRAVIRAGLDPKRYSAHSLRAGAVTTAAALGNSDQEIMRMSGHESPAVMRTYVRHARVFSGRNPLAGAM